MSYGARGRLLSTEEAQESLEAIAESSSSFLSDIPCFRCGGNHSAHTCQFKDLNHYSCKQKGHIADKCPNGIKNQSRSGKPKVQPNRRAQRRGPHKQRSDNVHQLENVVKVSDEDAGEEGDVYDQLFCVNSRRGHNPYKVTVLVNGVNVTMEFDTGASTTVVDEETFHNLSQSGRVLELNAVNTMLRTYTGEMIPPISSGNQGTGSGRVRQLPHT